MVVPVKVKLLSPLSTTEPGRPVFQPKTAPVRTCDTTTDASVSEPSVSVRATVIGTLITVSSLPLARPDTVGASAMAETVKAKGALVVAVEPSASVTVTVTDNVISASLLVGA